MTDFNIDEKRLIIAVLIAIMEADGVIDPNETDYLDKVILSLGITESELDTLDELDFNYIIYNFKKFDACKKEKARSMFLEMAKCDGYADPRELDIINRIGC